MQLYAFCYNNATRYVVLFEIFIRNTPSISSRNEVAILTNPTSRSPHYINFFGEFVLSGFSICVLGKLLSSFLGGKEVDYV
jgi:hypothetical protein